MKTLLAVIPLLLNGVVAEGPAPYPPSGFRPAGPAFELPQKNTQQQQQEYLPPVEPRRPLPPSTSYGTPEDDVSVQGLPTLEQQPIFQVSPINGLEYVGSNFNSDIRNLDDSYRQAQYQSQQERYREFERQRQLEAAQARNRASTPQPPRSFATESTVSTTEPTSTRNPDEFRTTESTTELDLNEGETLDAKQDDKKTKVTVEVSKQKIQEYPGELFLSSLAQLQLQPQFVPFTQLGQIRAPIYFQSIQQEQSQKQVAGYDAQTHFAALPSVLAQQQYLQGIQNQAFSQSPALLVARQQEPANVGFIPQNPQPIINNQYQPIIARTPQTFAQNPVVVQPQATPQPKQEGEEEDDEQNNQEQPQFVYQQSYQPQEVIYQPAQPQAPQQSQDQQNVFLPQAQLVNYPNPVQQYQNPFPQQANQPQIAQPQFVNPQQYQNGFVQQQFVDQNQFQNVQQTQIPQQQAYQDPQQVQFPQQQVQFSQQPVQFPHQQAQFPQQQAQFPQKQAQIPQQVYQDQGFVNQQVQYPQQVFQDQQQFINAQQQAPIPQFQGQDSLQSGLDANQQGNGVDQTEKDDVDDENNEDDGATSVAVATAFGARTQPRVFTRYGAPVPVPRQSADPQPDADADEKTEDSGSVAVANAFASGRRKGAKLRSRRVRPLFTLDRSGHLVLAQEQN